VEKYFMLLRIGLSETVKISKLLDLQQGDGAVEDHIPVKCASKE